MVMDQEIIQEETKCDLTEREEYYTEILHYSNGYLTLHMCLHGTIVTISTHFRLSVLFTTKHVFKVHVSSKPVFALCL